jgi:hypothetical protein
LGTEPYVALYKQIISVSVNPYCFPPIKMLLI